MENEQKDKQVNEPEVAYSISPKKQIVVFNSFEEMEQDRLKGLASLSHGQCLQILSRNRRRIFKDILLPDGTFPPFKKVIQISQLHYDF